MKLVTNGLLLSSFSLLLAIAAQAQNTFPSSGNVGIGTASPQGKLHINGANQNNTATPLFKLTDTNTNQSLAIDNGVGANDFRIVSWGGMSTLELQAGGNDNQLVLNVSGNVGIGTSTLSERLSVNGSIDGGGPGTGMYVRDAVNDINKNTAVTPLLLHEGLISGNGSTLAWGLHISSIPWTWGQDPMFYHAGIHSFLTRQGSGPESETMRITAEGNVGIGTNGPGAKLEVNGNIKLTSGSAASLIFADGTTQSTAWNGTLCGGDYAESIDVSGEREEYEPGDVLIVDPRNPGHFAKSSEPYSMAVSGVYSTKPGLVGRRQTTDPTSASEIPMAMVGIVPTKVSAENGPIRPGDVLVTSSTLGHAVKGVDRSQFAGAIVGKALGSLDSGTGVIEALISLQ